MTGIRLQALPARHGPVPRASSSIRIMQQLGGSFGSATLFIVVQHELTAQARNAAGLAAAFGSTFWWVLAFAGAMLIPVVFLPGRGRGAGVRESGLQSAEASCEDRRGQSAEASCEDRRGQSAEASWENGAGQRRRATGFTLMAGKGGGGRRDAAAPQAEDRAAAEREANGDHGAGSTTGEVTPHGEGIEWEYAPAPESREIVTLAPEYGLFLNGEFVPAASGQLFATVNPATEEPLARVAEAGAEDVDRAVAAARAAYEQVWGPMPGAERAKYLYRVARILQERSREFAVLESLDNGKPIKESRDVDVPLAAAHFFYHAGWADKLEHAGFGPSPRPVGVAGQVIPWNFPLLMAAWKLAPALAAGNTCVLKPAETTPLTALLLAEVCQQAGLPPGVVNVLTGAGETGAALVAHPGVDKVAFTGSTEVGKQIRRTVAGSPKRLTLELGGKAANVVFDDAPVEAAVEGIVNGIFFNQGHVCCAGSRMLVQESVADAVTARLRDRLGTLRLGDPLDKNTDIGAINSRQQLDKIRELSDAGEAEGAERWSPPCELPQRGFWFPPTVFTGVSQSHRIAREEIFGPVLSVLTFRTPEEAVTKANNTPYGLSAGVWTDKGSRILWLAQRLRAGVVWANTYNRFDPASPFGGYQESGFGREGGRHGLAAYLNV
jgi:aldehyde dehydrogenase (NAD+)